MDVGDHTTPGNSHPTKQGIQLLCDVVLVSIIIRSPSQVTNLVILHSQLNVTRIDALPLVITSSVACKLQDLRNQVL